MPGILPMKMIRVGGTNNQSRIAQACDRCRSKKIRCDGIRPCCSQCSNVGFECKTSDKLSRRAFPRGYTESLEDRVRGLEAEVRELKDLLDEKDEKIDMLSRLHSFSPIRKNSASLSPANSTQVKAEVASAHEDVLHVELPAPVHPTKSAAAGSSTATALIEAFESKVQEKGRPCPTIAPSALLSPVASQAKPPALANNASPAPPRLLSDQYINLFFQEWQPLLPILHRQTFLRLYGQFLAEPDTRSFQGNKLAIAQLFLIFEIAAHSSSSKARPNTASYELQWRKALSGASSTPSLAVLQCHVLAQLCYLLKADYHHLLRHRGYAVSLCHQLGLHQGRVHSLPPFEAESRKKVFWSQYVLDKFASATTGMPMLLRDDDITAEYPADVDDENISEQGLSPGLPGELTRISSALALFRMSRILSKTLEHLYPAKSSYSISLKKLHSLSDELDQWHEELPEHLRLRFCNDKPATHMISDRSPILSMAYFHTRSLIHRPLLCHGSGSAASAATIILAAAGKHILQIIDLLDERCMNYTFPVNKQNILLNAGFSILWQCLDLEDDSKLTKDNQKSLVMLISKLSKENTAACSEFQKVATTFVAVGSPRNTPKHIAIDTPAAKLLNTVPSPLSSKQKNARKQLQAIASRFSSFTNKDSKGDDMQSRKPGSPPSDAHTFKIPTYPRANSTISLISTQSAPGVTVSTPSPRTSHIGRSNYAAASAINLDYFSVNGDLQDMATQNSSATMLPPKKRSSVPSNNWEQLAPEFDSIGLLQSTVEPKSLNKCISNPETLDWTGDMDMWNLNGSELEKGHVPQSLLSFSDESLASGDDFVFSTAGSSHHGSMSTHDGMDIPFSEEAFKGITMPVSTIEDELDFAPGVHV